MKLRSRSFAPVVSMVGVFLIFSNGCSDKGQSSGAQIAGKVTYKGSPVPGGKIFFHPKGGGAPLYSTISPSGDYFQAGLAAGEMIVTIDNEFLKEGFDPNNPLAKMEGDEKTKEMLKEQLAKAKGMKMPSVAGKYIAIPAKYADKSKSGLSYTVTAGKQEKSFDLVD